FFLYTTLFRSCYITRERRFAMYTENKYKALIPPLRQFYDDYAGQIIAVSILLTLSTLGLSVAVFMALSVFIFVYCGQALYQLFGLMGRADEIPEALAQPTSERAGLYYIASRCIVFAGQGAACIPQLIGAGK